MLRRLYDRLLRLAASPAAPWWLALVSFAEASFFPIPPDVMLIPMALARPRAAWVFAAICTAASVAGGACGYLIGDAVFEQIARPILALYGYGPAYAAFAAKFQEYGVWIVLIKGLTPIPYKIVTIAAGAAQMAFWPFMLASLITRGTRFFLVAALLHYLGDPVRDFIERRLTLVTSAVAAGVVGGFLVLKVF
ncbi:YqaA family protein [Rhodopila sp.]|jgi:membrane protein YqaA with SNARE-associated domain|uniref:YqaA family protein n=1 Tax=Rhodopila sp. TaxID=2480087 RepID=UPI002C018132|nr:YqaA family protein [Rhodopila sp.]HVZ10186.1 YqaA family protein [Rhodopila sp.]